MKFVAFSALMASANADINPGEKCHEYEPKGATATCGPNLCCGVYSGGVVLNSDGTDSANPAPNAIACGLDKG